MRLVSPALLLFFLTLICLTGGSRLKKDGDVANEGSSGDTFPVMTVEEERPSSTTEPAPGFFTYYWSRFAEWWWPLKVESGPVTSESGPTTESPVLPSDDETILFSDDESAKEISLFGGASSSSASSLSKSSSSGEEKAGTRKMSYRNALEIDEEDAPADEKKEETMPEDPFERRAEAVATPLESGPVDTELGEFLQVSSN
jgi:hypothetical protein